MTKLNAAGGTNFYNPTLGVGFFEVVLGDLETHLAVSVVVDELAMLVRVRLVHDNGGEDAPDIDSISW